jgi:hypothetical protein
MNKNKNMRILILLFGLTLIFFSCKQTRKEKAVQQSEIVKSANDSSIIETLPPLEESEFTFSDKDFGEIIELKGASHPVNQLFKVSECEMIALDSVLIVKNRNNSEMFMAFSLPSFNFIKSFGMFGRGPGEFQFPGLVKDESSEFLCFIYERANNNLYTLNRDLEIKELPIEFQKGEKNFNDKKLYGISSKELLYVESINMGKAIFRIDSKSDSTNINLLKKLAFSDKYKNWAAYIGDFGANGKMKRAVFAYKYFKRLIFFDLESKTSKVISFDIPAKTKRGNAVSMMDPSNDTHYWGMSSQNKFVYVLYSGRTPIEVSKELKKSSGYIYLEKFDWNGNPISKYKLDHWGYFCVNEKENTIYLASTTDEHPFISYKLPED